MPYAGGALQIVLTITALLLPPLMAPTVWGLLSGRIGVVALMTSAALSFYVGLVIKLLMAKGGGLDGSAFAAWTQANPRMTDILVGAVLPNIILAVFYLTSRSSQPGRHETERRITAYEPSPERPTDHGSVGVVAASLAGSGILMLALLLFNDRGQGTLAIFGIVMICLALLSWRMGNVGKLRS